jgi:excisionase family DNA binding protein
METKAFITISQIAEEYGICRDYIDEAINSKILPYYLFGKKTRYIKRKDLENWIEKHKAIPIKSSQWVGR